MPFTALDSSLTGPLFVPDAVRAALDDRAFVGAMLRAEAALAAAQARFGLAPESLADAIAALGADDFDMAALGHATAAQGVPSIPFVKALQAKLPPDLEPHVHKGATSQDIVDTARVLQIRDVLDLIAADLRASIERLAALAAAHRTTPQIGRTYGQHAVPISFGFTVATWIAGLLEHAERLPALRRDVLTVSLGGPAGTLHALDLDGPRVLQAFGEALGLGVDTIAWHARRGRMLSLAAWLAGVTSAAAKMADDIVRLSATEVGELRERAGGGSSAMPHKQNPIRATAVLAAAQASASSLASLSMCLIASHQRPAGAWQAEWLVLPQLLALAAGAVRPLPVEADPARMRANIEMTRGLVYAEAIAAALTPSIGRAAAHERLEHAAASARDSGRSLHDVLAADEGLPLDPAALQACFDPAPFAAAAAVWTDRVLADVPRVCSLLSS